MSRVAHYRPSGLPTYQGRYFTGGNILSDSVRKIMPLLNEKLKSFSRKKLRDFAHDFTQEMDQGQGVRQSLKKAGR